MTGFSSENEAVVSEFMRPILKNNTSNLEISTVRSAAVVKAAEDFC